MTPEVILLAFLRDEVQLHVNMNQEGYILDI